MDLEIVGKHHNNGTDFESVSNYEKSHLY